MQKMRSLAAFVCLACLLLSSGCALLPKEKPVLKPPLVKPQQASYNLYTVKKGTVTKQIKGTGTFESTTVMNQEFKGATGRVTAVHVKKGDLAKKGTPLIELDNEGLDITAMERERDVKMAGLALELAKENRDERLMPIRLLELRIAENRLAEVRKQLEGKVMTAEIDGVVTAIEPLKPGDTVQLGKSYVTLADPASVRLSLTSAGSGDLQEVQLMMKADIAYKNQKLEGIVTQSPSSAPQTDNKQLNDQYARTIFFKLADSSIKPELGATADVVIVLQKRENVIVIPRSGLYSFLDRDFVRVLEGEAVREYDVEKGIESQSEIEIVKGLTEGQNIILQ